MGWPQREHLPTPAADGWIGTGWMAGVGGDARGGTGTQSRTEEKKPADVGRLPAALDIDNESTMKTQICNFHNTQSIFHKKYNYNYLV